MRHWTIAGLAASFMALSVAPQAEAQVYFRSWAGPVEYAPWPGPGGGPRFAPFRERQLHPGIVLDEFADQGFRDVALIARRPDVYVIEGTSPRGERVRFVVDAIDGEVLERFSQGQAAALRSSNLENRPATLDRSPSQAPSPLPTPPRRSAQAILPTPPSALARPLPAAPRPTVKDWAPINSVPVAPLD
jgi:hypothetical protein